MKKTIKNNILKKIQSGEVKMRSRMEILAEKLGIGTGLLFLFLGLIIISGLVSYWFNLNSDLIFGGYGRYGLRIFTQTFPYAFVFTFIALFILLSLILRRFDLSYKKPFIAILSVIIGLVLVLGWFSLNNPIGRGFYQNEGRFMGMGRMMNNANSINGQVLKVNGNEIVIITADGEKIAIKTSSGTHYPFGIPKEGDTVRSVGAWNGNYFEAIGVRVFDEGDIGGMMGGYGMGGMMNGQGKGQRWLR
jgi:hypothetical protein